jgi:hypothetical protein
VVGRRQDGDGITPQPTSRDKAVQDAHIVYVIVRCSCSVPWYTSTNLTACLSCLIYLQLSITLRVELRQVMR